jgi:F-box/leucine-rich repeat protein 2/20
MLRSAATLAAGELREVRIRHCSDDALAFAASRYDDVPIRLCKLFFWKLYL